MADMIGKLKELLGRGSGAQEPASERSAGGRLRRLSGPDSWAEARSQPVALIFKHSTICHTSATARREVERWADTRSDIPVYQVDVRADRAVSLQIASELQIGHESPQAILLVAGQPRWHESHWKIKAAALEAAVSGAS